MSADSGAGPLRSSPLMVMEPEISERSHSLPRVTFVVPVLNDAEGLDRCLMSIRRNHYPPELVEILVVDNGSSDHSVAVGRHHGAVVIELPGIGVAELRNLAAARASGDAIAFVDADHELDSRWLQAAARSLRQPGVGGAGAPYRSPEQPTWVQRMGQGVREHLVTAGDTNWLPSGNLVVWKSVFQATGGFDASLTTCEDVDFSRRIREAGYRMVNEPQMKSIHHGDARSAWALFMGELWRGRDNLRVSFREPMTLRSAPGALFPVLFLASMGSLVVALLLFPSGTWLLASGSAALSGIVLLRATSTLLRVGLRSPADVAFAAAFAIVYESARALALVARQRHRRARTGDALASPASAGPQDA